MLIVIEKELDIEIKGRENLKINKDTQIKIWEKLSGKWEDNRNTKEIIRDIYSTRSIGKDMVLKFIFLTQKHEGTTVQSD